MERGARRLVRPPTRAEKVASAAVAELPSPVAAGAPAPLGARILDGLAAALPSLSLVVVAALALRRLDDFDTWWHLASGRWIAGHASVPHTDVLSYTVPENEWINLQWLYDLLLYGLWCVGGANLLVLASAACFVGTFAILGRHLGRFTGGLTTTLLLCWVAAAVNERFLIRPEMATFPLLAAVQLVLTDGRTKPERLRWLVPLLLVWANTHSLFVLGLGAIACQVGASLVGGLGFLPRGWQRDNAWSPAARAALWKWGAAALVATLVNPYGPRALLFPFELMTRIDGSSPVYGVIGEFRPPFSGYFPTFAIGCYQAFVFAAAGLAVLAGMVRAFAKEPPRGEGARAEGFDLGALVFALVLGYLSLLARRNVGVFAIGALPFAGACAGILLRRLPGAWNAASAMATRTMAVLVLGAMAVVCAAVVSNRWYAATGETHEFGLGILGTNFQPRATAFFREQELPGPLFNDMTAGGYLTWDDPTGKGVYVDGRLEVYDTPFFGRYLDNMSDYRAWKKDADARGIQSAMVFHRWGNRQGFIHQLMASQEWRLVYYDEAVATLVRAGAHDAKISAAREAFAQTWRPRTEALLSGPKQTASWQWAVDRYTSQLAYATLLENLGDRRGSLHWLESALRIGLPAYYAVDTHQRVAQIYAAAGDFAQSRLHLDKALAIDPENATTRAMSTRLDEISR
jgi:hypothetical protein